MQIKLEEVKVSNKSNKKKSWLLPLAIVVLVLAILACGGEVSPTKVGEVAATQADETQEEATPEVDIAPIESEPTQPVDTLSPQGPIYYKVGDIISIGDKVMVVLGWDSPPGDQFSKPDEGEKFVVVDVLLVNQGSSTGTVSSWLQMSLKDDTGQKYTIDLMANVASGESSPDGELSSGERIRGKVGFQVPTESKGLVFVFDAAVFGTGKVFVELGPDPISLEPPAELVGELDQETFAVGDIIEMGDLTLTVNEIAFPEGDNFTKPDEGKKFIVVDLTLVNNSSEAKAVSSMLQMYLKDTTGQKYDLDLMASVASGGTTPDGEIAPSEKIRGQVSFQVPEDIDGLVFVFDADVFGFGKVFIVIPAR